MRERASVMNRLQKVLEAANIKLASVTKTGSVSAREMLEAMVAGKAIQWPWQGWRVGGCEPNGANWNKR